VPTPTPTPPPTLAPSKAPKSNTVVVGSGAAVGAVALFGLLCVVLKRKRRDAGAEKGDADEQLLPELITAENGRVGMGSMQTKSKTGKQCTRISKPMKDEYAARIRAHDMHELAYSQLVQATDDFKTVLGNGAFATVYLGLMSGSGQSVAVKVDSPALADAEEKMREMMELQYVYEVRMQSQFLHSDRAHTTPVRLLPRSHTRALHHSRNQLTHCTHPPRWRPSTSTPTRTYAHSSPTAPMALHAAWCMSTVARAICWRG
jgi:hypothetical protein